MTHSDEPERVAQPHGPPARAALTITAVRLRRLRLELDPPFRPAWDPAPRRAFDATLVVVDTSEGIVGVGSGDTMDGFEAFILYAV